MRPNVGPRTPTTQALAAVARKGAKAALADFAGDDGACGATMNTNYAAPH